MMKYIYFISYTAKAKGKDIYGMCEFTSKTKIKSVSQLNECANDIVRECFFDKNSCIINNFSFLRFKFSFSKSS